MDICADGAVMKRLILLFLLLFSLGAKSQDISLLESNKKGSDKVGDSQSSPNPSPLATIIVGVDAPTDGKNTNPRVEKNPSEKLIEKADEYFAKMWYAEAARVYDLALEESDAKHTMALLSKAGDAHYYTGNLEKAHKWYHELYESFGDQVSEDTFLKYTQALKGTGKYRRAATITKLFKQKRGEPFNELENLPLPSWNNASVKIKNLSINSVYSDFSPMFHKDSELVFSSARDTSFLTTRRYRWNNQPFLDLYVAKVKNEEGDLSGTKKFSRKINTKYHEASVAFSPDQQTIYFTRNNYGKRLKRGKEGINHLKIYRSNFIDGEWTEAEELAINGENYSTGHPCISPDGKKMYFVSDRPGGYGQTDIYVVDILENGGFSEPENLGRTINTDAKEMFPYVVEGTLYFSSNRHMGLGGLDVYQSDFSNGVFSVAVNLGEPINSNRDDFSFIIDSLGKKGYFASNRKGGKGDDDIYSFVKTENLNVISGVVKDAETQETIEAVSVQLLDNSGKSLSETSTEADGRYLFKNLVPRTAYRVKASKKGYYDDEAEAVTKSNETILVDQSLKVRQEIIDVEKNRVVLDPDVILFDFDSYHIRPRAAQELDKLVATMKEHRDLVIKIESHTDAIGNGAYNKYLSDKRAKSTRDYLVSQGVDPSQIESAIGYGEERLLNNCSDGKRCPPEKHRLNRRSEFIIVSQ